MTENLDEAALEYHRAPKAGKLEVVATKPLANQRDLALAYSPGVAAACRAIVGDPGEAMNLTARGNMVGVVTNGTAVLGLGTIGPLAAKPVMEGKAALEPTFGAINLEDIKAPECFVIEGELRKRMNIPVFHDDQHGTCHRHRGGGNRLPEPVGQLGATQGKHHPGGPRGSGLRGKKGGQGAQGGAQFRPVPFQGADDGLLVIFRSRAASSTGWASSPLGWASAGTVAGGPPPGSGDRMGSLAALQGATSGPAGLPGPQPWPPRRP